MRAAALPLTLALAACTVWEEAPVDGLRVRTATGFLGPSGVFVAEVPVEAGETSLLLTATLDDAVKGYTARVRDPSGAVVYEASDWWDASRNKTNGGFASPVVTMQWPVDPNDAPLRPGTWRLEIGADRAHHGLAAHVGLKADAEPAAGRLRLRGRVTRAVADDPDLGPPTERAFAAVRDGIYADFGLEVDLVVETWDGPATLTTPGYGDTVAWEDATADKALREVIVVVVETFDQNPDVFGAAGGIPGSLVPSDRAAVGIAAVLSAGADARFSATEEALYAETIAHEVGHYLGLFHPAEIPRSGTAVTSWDVLADTEECARFDGCVARLGGNLMFPTPLCAGTGPSGCEAFVAQRTLTPDQLDVLHRHVAVE